MAGYGFRVRVRIRGALWRVTVLGLGVELGLGLRSTAQQAPGYKFHQKRIGASDGSQNDITLLGAPVIVNKPRIECKCCMLEIG